MSSISETQAFKKKSRPDSFYEYITSKYISKPLIPLFIKLGLRNPNSVTVISFLLLIAASALLLKPPQFHLMNRIIVVLLIEISFIFDASDGQLARILNKTSLFGAWLDVYLDRIGEMVLYTTIGYVTWKIHGHFIYLIIGLGTGFLFTYYTIIFSLKDSVVYEEIRNNYGKLISTSERKGKSHEQAKSKKIVGKRLLKNDLLLKTLNIAFFYLNMGLGERYLYPIFFILINRTDIMLLIVITLIFLRAGDKTLLLSQRLKKYDSNNI